MDQSRDRRPGRRRERKAADAETSLTVEQVLNLLKEAPARITAITAGLDQEKLHATPAPGEWSANEVLAHLRSCADVWGNCITVIIAEDTPTIRAISPRTWIKRTGYLEAEFRSSLEAFASQRSELLALIEPLPLEGWTRSAKVTGAGKVLERSVLSYAEWLATHERTHLRQIEKIVMAIKG